MPNIIADLERIFGSIQDYYESTAEINCKLIIKALPDENDLMSFLSSFPPCDKLTITISDCADDNITITHQALWADEYRDYKAEHADDEEFTVAIILYKQYEIKQGLYVYSSEHFVTFLKERTTREIIDLFSGLFAKNPSYIRFTVLDNKLSLYTNHVAFCNPSETWPIEETHRAELCRKCMETSAFLDHHNISLIPQDFHIINSSNKYDDIAHLFRKIESILAYAYVATSAYLSNNRLVFYIDPGHAIEQDFDAFPSRGCITDIFHWAYSTENAMERVSIARNVLKVYCRNIDTILNIDNSILLSIKSNYNIYQKDTTEKYIELKEKISDFIISLTPQMNELYHGLIDGFKNNFIAIVTFAITVLLTESLTSEEIMQDGFSDNMLFVSYIFVVVTALYWIATIISTIFKWSLITQNYKYIKSNYKDILDETDLTKAFNDDKALKSAKTKVILSAILVSVLWVIFIIAMIYIIKSFSSEPPAFVPPSFPYYQATVLFDMFIDSI